MMVGRPDSIFSLLSFLFLLGSTSTNNFVGFPFFPLTLTTYPRCSFSSLTKSATLFNIYIYTYMFTRSIQLRFELYGWLPSYHNLISLKYYAAMRIKTAFLWARKMLLSRLVLSTTLSPARFEQVIVDIKIIT